MAEVKTEEKIELNPKQELFCKLFASDREFFGNGVQSYVEAYDIDITRPGAYNSARAMASTLLTNVNILTRINELIDASGLNDSFIDKQLYIVATQNADLRAKVEGIREYNKLKARITEKIDHTTNGEKIVQQPLVISTIAPREHVDTEEETAASSGGGE